MKQDFPFIDVTSSLW